MNLSHLTQLLSHLLQLPVSYSLLLYIPSYPHTQPHSPTPYHLRSIIHTTLPSSLKAASAHATLLHIPLPIYPSKKLGAYSPVLRIPDSHSPLKLLLPNLVGLKRTALFKEVLGTRVRISLGAGSFGSLFWSGFLGSRHAGARSWFVRTLVRSLCRSFVHGGMSFVLRVLAFLISFHSFPSSLGQSASSLDLTLQTLLHPNPHSRRHERHHHARSHNLPPPTALTIPTLDPHSTSPRRHLYRRTLACRRLARARTRTEKLRRFRHVVEGREGYCARTSSISS